ncbi:MAG: NADH-quinone oxidoreductase subunit J [Chloroflexi bacterium]|nr:NADH-quinone oxidoreductase subunit J [Chloroflexota bacterium]
MTTEILWWIFAVAIVAVSAGVVFARTVIHSAIFLILSLAGVGAMYLFLTIEFIALVQFLIYGGAVTVLILLALMLTRMGVAGRPEPTTGVQAPFGALVAAGLMATLIGVAVATAWPGDPGGNAVAVSITTIGEQMFQHYGAPFMITAALLLVAFIGAIVIARQEDDD